MKKILTACALTLTGSVFADACCEPCEPCCIPCPRAPICCECYTPAFDDMQCDWNVFFDAEFLYWFGRENNLAYAIKGEVINAGMVDVGGTSLFPNFALVSNKALHFDTSWDPGVRIGLGYKLNDGWDIGMYWTYYHTHTKNSHSSSGTVEAGDVGFINPWIDEAILGVTGPIFNTTSASWHSRFNQIDLEIGRKYFLSQCFIMRPYMGIRGAWANTHFHTKNSSAPFIGSTNLFPYTANAKTINRNWGIGLLGGIQPSWYFTEEFSMVGNIGIALLCGKLKMKSSQDASSSFPSFMSGGPANRFNADFSSQEDFFGIQPVLDLSLALRWETCWCENRYRFAVDAGWEQHVWFNYNTRTKPGNRVEDSSNGPDFRFSHSCSYTSESNNLMMGGLVIKARFDF